MTIGIDISALQSAHRMRGIGFTILNFINHISEEDRQKHRFIFFMYEKEDNNPLELFNLEGMEYGIRFLPPLTKNNSTTGRSLAIIRFKRLFTSTARQLEELRSRYIGNTQIKDVGGIDVFIQPDQSQSLPAGLRMKKVLILYDLIPYILEWDYMWSYSTARIRGLPRLAALRCQVRRWLYIKKLKINVRKADLLLAISQHTKNDFIHYTSAKEDKIVVTHLGVSHQEVEKRETNYTRYVETSWGYSPRPYKFQENTPYLLFMGGADHRRKLDHLVVAFNHLRAQGENIKLILAGDTLQGPRNIPTMRIQEALQNSSYLDDIVFMGFVPDDIAEALFKHALAFVYPSMYEGFGLPILQAMRYGTPVITYSNSSIKEIAGDAALYVEDYSTIIDSVKELLNDEETLLRFAKAGQIQSSKFSWDKTSKSIIQAL